MPVRLLLALLTAFLATGCNIINPAEPVPTYVRIDSFRFVNPTPAATAGSTHQIRTVFVSLAGKIVGTFDLPATIPILMDAPGRLELFPGVDNGGTVSNQILYPFYSLDTVTVQPAPGATLVVTPKTGYLDAANRRFAYQETFESSNDFTAVSGAPFTTTSVPGQVIDGIRSGFVQLDSAGVAGAISSTSFTATGSDVFLEIDYRTTALLVIGVYSVSSQGTQYVVTLKPAPAGNKVYVSLGSALSQILSTTGYRVLLRVQTAEGTSSGYAIVDNIKVVTKK